MKLQRISIVVWKANHDECLQMNFKCCKLDVAHVFCGNCGMSVGCTNVVMDAKNQQLATWLHSTPSKQQLLGEWLGSAAF